MPENTELTGLTPEITNNFKPFIYLIKNRSILKLN